MKGKWRIVKMPDYTSDFPDMVEPAYILFNGKGGGEFAFGAVTGAIHGAGDGEAIEFSWEGNDEMDEAGGDGWAELRGRPGVPTGCNGEFPLQDARWHKSGCSEG
jgi:hypothetical protein